MNWAFWTCAALMVAAALLPILRPLLRRADDGRDLRRKREALDAAHAAGVIDAAEYRDKRAALDGSAAGEGPRRRALPVLPLALAGLVPALTLGVYLASGTPAALVAGAQERAADGGAQAATAASMEQAIASLAARLEREPEDLQGWLLLGRAYKSVGRFADAQRALERARALAPEDNDTAVEYAEALSLARSDRLIEGQARTLLEQAVARDPLHQRALWLLGIADAQAGDYAAAVAHWERLLPLLDAGSEVAASVAAQIDEARERAGLPPRDPTARAAPSTPAPALDSPAAADPEPAAPAAGAARLTVIVELSPELRTRVAPTDTLYVFARAPAGPRMPLALQRLSAAQFPVTVVLDDSMGMLPQLRLSDAAEVVVGARISKSGIANPQAGDLEGLSAPLAPATAREPVRIVISRVLP